MLIADMLIAEAARRRAKPQAAPIPPRAVRSRLTPAEQNLALCDRSPSRNA
jgi:hypothetical protein